MPRRKSKPVSFAGSGVLRIARMSGQIGGKHLAASKRKLRAGGGYEALRIHLNKFRRLISEQERENVLSFAHNFVRIPRPSGDTLVGKGEYRWPTFEEIKRVFPYFEARRAVKK